MAEKENKLSILLSEYKHRIDQNKSMLKSRSTQELNKTNQSTGHNSQKPPIGKQFEKYEKNITINLNESKGSKHNFNSASKENDTMRTDEDSLKNARQELNSELNFLRE